jgi:glycosyltransferase involved in cell wall biosynthesis
MPKKISAPTRILWLTSSFPRFNDDSASIFLRNLAISIQKEKFEIHIVAPDHSVVNDNLQSTGILLHRFQYFFPRSLQRLAYGSGILPNLKNNPLLFFQIPLFFLSMANMTFRTIRNVKPKILHAHWIFPQGFFVVILGKLFKIPVILTSHGSDAFGLQSTPLKNIKRWSIRHCTAWTCNSIATANAFGKDLPKPHIIPMGINIGIFKSGNEKLLDYEIPSTNSEVILFVGRLYKNKGLHNLITAFSLFTESLKDKATLWVIGDGIERNSLEALSKSLGLKDKIIFFGHCANDRLPNYYAAADILVIPTTKIEGQGLTILEAFASKTAVIGTKVGGILEMIENGKTGLLVEPDNPHELKLAIEELTANKYLRNTLIAEAENSIKDYDWQLIAKKFVNLYQYLLD